MCLTVGIYGLQLAPLVCPHCVVRLDSKLLIQSGDAKGGQCEVFTIETAVPDRRTCLREIVSYHGRARGVDMNANTFKTAIVIDNMSVNGLYLRTPRMMKPGSTARIALRFATNAADVSHKMVMAIRGVVLRVDSKSVETWGVAIAFARYRMLFMRDHPDCS